MPDMNVMYGSAGGGGETATIQWAQDIRIPREWFHEDWLKREPEWRLFRLCYVGGREFIASKNPLTLFSHERESGKSYADRCRRAFLRNHCAPIVGLKSDAIYQPQVLRNQGKPEESSDAASDAPPPAEDLSRVKRTQA